MKRLILLRHAKSGWDDPVSRDFDRPLNAKGERAARAVGRHARDHGFEMERLIASPAERVKETLVGFADGLGRALDPQWDRRVYLASATTLMEVLRETDDGVSILMMSGHNPGFEDLILALVPDSEADALRSSVEEKLPTASLVTMELAIEHWSDIEENCARIVAFVRPRDLDPALGPHVQ